MWTWRLVANLLLLLQVHGSSGMRTSHDDEAIGSALPQASQQGREHE